MDARSQIKQKRHKKRKSRTEVSSDSESEVERKQIKQVTETQEKNDNVSVPVSSSGKNEAEISDAFNKYYMQRATTEFAEDLDKIRGADDFKDEALSILVGALQQGTKAFSIEEQRRIVTAGAQKEAAGE